MNELQQALALLDRFERGEFVQPSEAERLLVQIFEACSYPVAEKGFIGSANSLLEVDCFIRAKVDGSLKTIAVEVKAGSRPAGVESVEQAFRLKTNGPFDRAMIVSRLGFSPDALQHADTVGLGQIDLFGPEHLRNWLSKQVEPQDTNSICENIVRRAMRDLAKAVAQHPEILSDIEWRDLERLLREVFEGIGFDTKLTRRPGAHCYRAQPKADLPRRGQTLDRTEAGSLAREEIRWRDGNAASRGRSDVIDVGVLDTGLWRDHQVQYARAPW